MQVEENRFTDLYDRRRLYDNDDIVVEDEGGAVDKRRKKLVRSTATTPDDDDDECDDPLMSQNIETKVTISTHHGDDEEEERSFNESLSRSSSVASSARSLADDDSRGEHRGALREKSLKRKSSAQTPNSEHDPGYDTMLAGSNFDDWIGTSSGPEDDVSVVKKVVFEKTVPVTEPAEPFVEYTRGMTCSNVKTALTILRTRYSLRNIQVSKHPSAGREFIDIHKTMTNGYRPPTEGSPSIGLYAPKQNPYFATEQMKEITKKIFLRDLEIKEILAKILAADEQQRRLEADLLKPKLYWGDEKMDEYNMMADSTPIGKSRKQTSFSPVVQVERQRPQSEGAQRESTGDDENVPKRRKRNVFQRAAHALRKRITSG